MTQFDTSVIVVGGGHAGSEAALASARMGISTILITSKKDAIATMPCNPSIGGLAKSHLVYELDALGGEMGKNADATALQAKTLNRSRGPAVWATRTQCAKQEYTERMQQVIAVQPNLHVIEDSVTELIVEIDSSNSHSIIRGVKTEKNGDILSKAVVITAGTSLRGRIWIGKNFEESGGDYRPAVNQLSTDLLNHGFKIIRLKTGTPPRLAASSCNFSLCQCQKGENPRPLFHVEHFLSSKSDIETIKTNVPRGTLPDLPCWLTHTTQTTHDIIRNNLDKSALYGGAIEGTGVRYCPSIEDKIVRFADKERHQLFLEPESENGQEFYLNGFSSSLPMDIQVNALHTIPGLENARIYRPGYAIEYDYSRPIPDFQFMENEITDRSDEFDRTVISMHIRPYCDEFNNNVSRVFQRYVTGFPGLLFCTAAHEHKLFERDLFGDGVIYYMSDCMKAKSYYLFTITPEGYEREVVYY